MVMVMAGNDIVVVAVRNDGRGMVVVVSATIKATVTGSVIPTIGIEAVTIVAQTIVTMPMTIMAVPVMPMTIVARAEANANPRVRGLGGGESDSRDHQAGTGDE
jgi:hypothetical protein